MMKPAIKFCILLLSTLFPIGCSTPLFAPPTGTPIATHTPTTTPTPTATATVTATPSKTLTPTPKALVELGERHLIGAGGFSVRVPFGYASQIEERQALISNLEGTLIISLASGDSTASEEAIIDEYLDALAQRSEGIFEKKLTDPVTVDGQKGKAFDLTGSFFGSPLRGKTLIVRVGSVRYLYALAFSNLSQDETAWETYGSKVFEAVLESVEFVP